MRRRWGNTAETGTLPNERLSTLDAQRKTAVCTVRHVDTGEHCYAQPAGVVTLGCQHEHLHYAAICALCRWQMNRLQSEGSFTCHYCRTCSEPHDCEMQELAWEPR